MTFGSLFSGVGGLDLGLERAGLRCLWQVEASEYRRLVLAKHWPNVPKWDDVRTFMGDGFERPDAICGGFPCQDLSLAGGRAGLEGERSGLWWEFARIVRLFRPRYVVVENVPGLLAPVGPGRPAPIGCVLGELASLGYDAEWDSIPASAFGSTQQRYRVFIIAHLAIDGNRPGRVPIFRRFGSTDPKGLGESVGGPPGFGAGTKSEDANLNGIGRGPGRTGRTVALHEVRSATGQDHPESKRRKRRQGAKKDGHESGERKPPSQSDRRDSPFVGSGWWGTEPEVVRMVYGVPRRLVRPAIAALGDSVIPQVAQWIGERLMASNPRPGGRP